MLARLLNDPGDSDGWAIWSWHHRLSHEAIASAIQRLGGLNLVVYQLDPIVEDDLQGFLQRNANTHEEMNAALGVQGTDLENVDLDDPAQRQAWLFIHYQQHFTAESALGIGS